MRARTAGLIVLFVAADAVACTAILGVTDIPPGPGADAGVGGGNDAGYDAPPGCPVRYVSAATGSDGNDGCTKATPFKTIKAAIGAVETVGEPGYTVQVCAGTYPESDLRIALAGAILGGFNCGNWMRTNSYGYGKFDQANETIVTYATTASSKVTVEIPGKSAAGTAPLLFDGFSVKGPAGVDTSVALKLDSSTDAVVSNCIVTGADATASTYAVMVTSGNASIAKNRIVSGAVSGATGQSAGIRATGGAPRITSNVISGTGSSVGSSFGISIAASSAMDLSLAASSPILGNTITAGAGYPSVGLSINGPVTVDVIGNVVQAGTATAPNGNTSSIHLAGISVTGNAGGATPVRIVGNRVYGGGSGTPGDGIRIRGVFVSTENAPIIAGNLIYGGYHFPITAGMVVAGALEIYNATAPVVAENTIFTGFSSGSVAYDVQLTGTTSGATVRDNILAGAGNNESGVQATDCTSLAALEHNLFVGLNNNTLSESHCNDAGAGSATDISKLATLLPGVAVDGNLIMESVCSAGDDGGSCVVNPDCAPHGMLDGSPGCLSTLFPPGWTQTNGYALWGTSNWALQPGVSCQILRGGLDLSAAGFPFTNDYFDAGRGTRPTIGAVESDAGGSCP